MNYLEQYALNMLRDYFVTAVSEGIFYADGSKVNDYLSSLILFILDDFITEREEKE